MADKATDIPAPSRVLLRRAAVFSASTYLLLRTCLSLLGVAVVDESLVPAPEGFPSVEAVTTIEPGIHNLFDATSRWDAGWFIEITATGYDPADGSAEFYPAFPLAARIVAWSTPLGPAGGALLVANLAFAGALFMLYLLSTLEFSEAVARRTVVLLSVYPASFVFLSPFSESLFLLATVATFYLARRGRSWASAVAGVVATATRVVGVWLIPALLLEARLTDQPAARRVRIITSLVPGLGVAAYLGFWWITAGDPTIPLRAPALWGRTVQFPPLMLGRAVAAGVQGVTPSGDWTGTVDLALTAILAAPVALWWRSLRDSYALYTALTFVVLVSVTFAERPLAGAPRYASVLFPAFWLLAIKLRGVAFTLAVVAAAAGWVALARIFMEGSIFLF